MNRLIADLEKTNPTIRAVMLNALRNVRPTHLLDTDLAEAWAARPAEIAPTEPPKERPTHFAASARLKVV
jgi:tRNA 2-thiocytidine biosynthesis protein TtcA